MNLEAKSGESTLFMVELQQAGIFHIETEGEEERREALGVAGPDALFPYARETLDTLLVKGTFPPFMLAPVNFDTPLRGGEEAPRGRAGHRLNGHSFASATRPGPTRKVSRCA